jgi:hypothetical protein
MVELDAIAASAAKVGAFDIVEKLDSLACKIIDEAEVLAQGELMDNYWIGRADDAEHYPLAAVMGS